LNALAGGAEHRLGLEHRGGGQRADGRALVVVEGEEHDLAAVGVERQRAAESVGQRKTGAGRESGVPGSRFGLRASASLCGVLDVASRMPAPRPP